MAILKYYKVDSDGKIKRLRRECPSPECGPSVFMSLHSNRQYCGRCGLTVRLRATVELFETCRADPLSRRQYLFEEGSAPAS